MINAASWTDLHPPHWSRALMIAAVAVLASAMIAGLFNLRPNVARRIYWIGWIVGGALAAAAVSFRGWAAAAAVFGLAVFVAVAYAYVFTAHLQFRGTVFALSGRRRRPDANGAAATPAPAPFGGDISAPKFWWLIVLLMILGGADVALRGWGWVAIAFTAMMIAIAATSGLDDGSRRVPIARREYVQAFIVAVASIPLFGTPVAVYLLGYFIGKRRPVRYGRHDRGAHTDRITSDPEDLGRDR